MDHALVTWRSKIFTSGCHDRRKFSLNCCFCLHRELRRVPSTSRSEKVNVKRLTGYWRALNVRAMGATEVGENLGVAGRSYLGLVASNGSPEPLGATVRDGGVNFAVFSSGATSASLCLFSLADLKENKTTASIPLDPELNKTGHIWHIFVKGELVGMLYGYTFDGPFSPKDGHYFDSSLILVDPYAKAVVSRDEYGVPGYGGNCWPQMAGLIPSPHDEFDWEGDLPLTYPQRDLIIYEMHIRGFTQHESSRTKYPGTYLGVTEKLDHLKELGINCIELMPCHEFNELEYFSQNSATGEKKFNFWGYSTVNFFSPMIRYSSAGSENCGLDAINEFKFLIREAHKRGIEVLLDVVFNHTAEGNQRGPILSFRGLDNGVYYMIAPKGEFYNYSGCGNTFNCNHPVVRQFIVDCLRYWVIEMHVDGFRFDLASIMTRASSLWDAVNVHGNPVDGDDITTGTPLTNPPLIEMITDDPILRKVKLIAEAWDAGGLYQVGKFPHGGVWSEWNGQYRDVVRQFIKGTDGFAGAFAKCLCGSPDLYQDGGRKPWHSINFVCAHDGFTLADLVSYNSKNNFSNGENNNDGENHNNSWNCGQEGETHALPVIMLRKRQMRNLFLCLMVSQGVPMILMGDEYGHSKGGNNNTYCHDNHLNYFRWDQKEESSQDFFRFCRLITRFRRECESFGLEDFPTGETLQWHGIRAGNPDWSITSRFVAFSQKNSGKGEIFVAFNASHRPTMVELPERPGQRWELLVDTAKPPPFDFLSDDTPDSSAEARRQFSYFLDANVYPMLSYSSEMAFQGFGGREIDGFIPAKVKRKDLEEVYDEFSEFSLSSPPRKIRRLEAELPPIMEEDELPVELPPDIPSSSTSCFAHPNEERALVLYKPVSALPLPFDPPRPSTIKIDADLMASLKSQSQGLVGQRTKERISSHSLALVPWMPPSQPLDAMIFARTCERGDDAMESDDVGVTSMDVESGSGGLQQWQHQQRYHCMSSQVSSGEPTQDIMSSWG